MRGVPRMCFSRHHERRRHSSAVTLIPAQTDTTAASSKVGFLPQHHKHAHLKLDE